MSEDEDQYERWLRYIVMVCVFVSWVAAIHLAVRVSQ